MQGDRQEVSEGDRFRRATRVPERHWYQRLLHNQTAYSLQRRLQWDGVPMVILPTRVKCARPGLLSPQLTAFFTSAAILDSAAAVNSTSAKAVGHMAPSSRFAACMKPTVAYLVLNFCALWKKQTILPLLA